MTTRLPDDSRQSPGSRAITLRTRYRQHHFDRSRYGFSFGEDARAAVFSDWIGQGCLVLDAGCRDGTLLRHYARGNRVVGCDIDDRALGLCRGNCGAQVLNADISVGLPLQPRMFDAAVLGEVLEHLPDPLFTLRELHRVLRSGGILVGSVPNAYRLKNRVLFAFGRPFDPDPTHLHYFSEREIRALLAAAGFIQVHVVYRESRLLRLSQRLFGNTMLWKATVSDIHADAASR